jgi:putative PIN family toxin of toxin-antitoxin system
VIRAVLDTNVLVSALLSPAGAPGMVLLAVNHGLVRPCVSEAILAENANVLARPKFGFSPNEIAALIATLRRTGELVDPNASSFGSPDPR